MLNDGDNAAGSLKREKKRSETKRGELTMKEKRKTNQKEQMQPL